MAEEHAGAPDGSRTAGDIFDRLDPKDGFHVVQVDLGASLSLHCQAYGGGELYNLTDPANPDVATVQIKEWLGPTPADYGECTRLRLVLDAVARYLTTGGSWEELLDALPRVRRVAVAGMAYEGYHLCDSYVTSQALYQHVFVREDGTGEAVLWEEPDYAASGGLVGGFIDRTTLAKIREQQENDDTVWGKRPAQEEAVGGPDRVPLLGIEDLPAEEDA